MIEFYNKLFYVTPEDCFSEYFTYFKELLVCVNMITKILGYNWENKKFILIVNNLYIIYKIQVGEYSKFIFVSLPLY